MLYIYICPNEFASVSRHTTGPSGVACRHKVMFCTNLFRTTVTNFLYPGSSDIFYHSSPIILDLNDGKIFTTMKWLMVFCQSTIVVDGFSMVFFTCEPLVSMVFQWFFRFQPLVSMVFQWLFH